MRIHTKTPLIIAPYLLVLSVVSGDSTVSSFSFTGLAIGCVKDRGHQTKGTVTLSDNIGLNITIIVLTSPDKVTVRLEALGNHIINKTVLVPDTSSIELRLIVLLEDLFKDILETTIIGLKDGVLGTQVQGHLALESNTETSMGKSFNGLVGVVHGHTDTTRLFKVVDFKCLGLRAIGRSESHFKLTGTRCNKVSGLVLC
jgi:hypothetical protein